MSFIDRFIQKRVKAQVDATIELHGERIAREAIQGARPEIVKQAQIEFVQDFARASGMNPNGTYNPVAQVPGGYPQVGKSPLPLYGMDRPMWYAAPVSPRRRPDSIVDIDTIIKFADSYDVLRSCINHLKREVSAQRFVIAPKNPANNDEQSARRVDEATAFFSKQGGLGEFGKTRRWYENVIFEDALVVGAYAVYFNYSKGGQLLSTQPVASETIRPRVDAFGWPGPGDEQFEQWILGMKIRGFTANELTYDGLYPVTRSPYYKSPVEYLITTVLSALKSDEWNRSWLTDGNTPGQFITLPKEWSPQDIIEYQDYFDQVLAGNARSRQKSVFAPEGSVQQTHSRKDQDFKEFDLWLLRRTCAIMGVQPASIGFAGEQYKVSQENSSDSTTQFGAGALIDLRKEHYDDILERLGYGDLEIVRSFDAEESPSMRASRVVIETGAPSKTINEGRAEMGLDPVEGGDILLIPNLYKPLGTSTTEDNKEENQPGEPDDDPSEDVDDPEERVELAKWQKKATNRLRSKGSASCEFRSDSIREDVAGFILERLGGCKSDSDVKKLFRAATSKPSAEPQIVLTAPETATQGKTLHDVTVKVTGKLQGTITVTPNDGGMGGIFVPPYASFAKAGLVEFAYLPLTAGKTVLGVNSSGGLMKSNPVEVTVKESDTEGAEDTSKNQVRTLLLLLGGMASGVQVNVGELASKELSKAQFIQKSMDEMFKSHIEAAWLGRIRASGEIGPISSADKMIGSQEAMSQLPFLTGFADDVLGGKVSFAQATVRAKAYAQRLVGTANRGWLNAIPGHVAINWIDVDDDRECPDCLGRAADNPYTRDTLPSVPGDGSTQCVTNCRCYLETEDGKRSFYDSRDGDISA